MATIDQLSAALIKADAAGDTTGAKALAAEVRRMSGQVPRQSLADQIPGIAGANTKLTPAAPEDSFLDKVKGAGEAALSIGTGMVGGAVGGVAGLVKGVTGGKYGTQAGVREAADTAHDVSNALTYQPRTQTGNKLAQAVGNAINDSGIIGLAPMAGDAVSLSRAVAPAKNALRDLVGSGASMAADVGTAGANKLSSIAKHDNPAMAGVGAAATGDALLRTQRAADMPVPIRLTKGQATRSFSDHQFERETAKMPEGEPLRQRFADQNQQVLQNFDAFTDSTGAQAGNLRATGKVVTDALVQKMADAKSKIRSAYDAARDAGQMNEPVDISSISKYINDNRPAALNAPILNSVEQSIRKLDPAGSGKISINDLEELRKMTGRLAQPGTPNSAYGGDIKGMIDAATEGRGGEMYQQARRMYENYSREFKNAGVIDKMMRTKPGTNDRAVAYEDVFNHSIMDGSLDDVRKVRRTLQTAGDDGAQAWRELQGATINNIKDTVTANSARDIRGNPIVSPDKLNRIVAKLDADGKLDFIFGKQGAQKIRDVNDMAKDIYTSPPGSVNSSNTASALMNALDKAAAIGSGIPVVGQAVKYGVRQVKTNALNKRVNSSLNYLQDAAQP